MFRKLAVLHRIIGFAFGPAVKELVLFLLCAIFRFVKVYWKLSVNDSASDRNMNLCEYIVVLGCLMICDFNKILSSLVLN